MRKQMAVIGASVALAIGGLAACANGQDVVRSDAAGATAGLSGGPGAAVQRAAQKTTDVDTAKIALTLDLTGVPGLSDTNVTVDGALDTKAGASQFTFDLSKLAGALPGGESSAITGLLGD